MRLLHVRPTSCLLRVWLLLLLVLLAGCTLRQPAAEVPLTAGQFVLQEGSPIGQTFVARAPGLAGIDVFLAPATPGDGSIMLHLLAGPHASASLASATLPLPSVTQPDFYGFDFPALPASAQQDYYLLLQVAGSGSVAVGSAPGASGLDGALYQAGTPQDAQLIFQQVFALPALLQGVVVSTVPVWGAVLAAGMLLYVLPGWALLVLLRPSLPLSLSAAQQLTLAGGISLAIYPLLLLWTDIVGLHLGALYAWGPVLLAAAVLLWHYRPWQLARLRAGWQAWRQGAGFWPDVALLLLVLLVFGVRLAVIAPLDAPMWGDSYNHSVITQLIIQHGGLFSSWKPYADLQTFTYHFGFHTTSALFHWITGSAAPRAVLWNGQLLNGLAVLTLYPLALHIGHSRWAGVGAVLLAGLLVPMPMYYLNWGRYTQLTGQVILPAAAYVIWHALQARPSSWQLTGLASLLLAGLALAHYRVFIFMAVLCGVLLLVLLSTEARYRLWKPALLMVAGASLLFLPWFVRALSGRLVHILDRILYATAPTQSDPQVTAAQIAATNSIGDIAIFLPIAVWLLMAGALGWGLWRRERGILVVACWCFLLLLLTNPHWLHLPGAGMITNFAIFIAAYIPVSLVLGAASGWLVEYSRRAGVWARGLPYAWVSLVLVLAIWGAFQRPSDIAPERFALVTRPDIRAMAWIRARTPAEARFLIPAFPAYNNAVVVGADGGWWLPLLAERQTNVPPIGYSFDRGSEPGYRLWVNELVNLIGEHGITHPTVLAEMQARSISHVYIGQVQGTVGSGAMQLFSAQELLASPAFELVYHEDRVYIFAFNSHECQTCPAQ